MASKRKMNQSPESFSYLVPGSLVEISSDDAGFRGSWYEGKVVKRPSPKTPNKIVVEYTSIFADDEGTKPLVETLETSQLRPVPPREKGRDFKFSEEVDALHNDGWWEGVITAELDNGRFHVFFRATKEQLEFGKEQLRLHREWVNDAWIPPLEEEEEEGKQEVKVETKAEVKRGKQSTKKSYTDGELLEVSSDDEGFQGAWFDATLIKVIEEGKYLIEYKSLRTDDDTAFLREEVDEKHIRPCPPEIVKVDSFSKLEEVDAWYNDGWWVGVIAKVHVKSRYTVYFKGTDEEMEFPYSQLRLHQEWLNGEWVVPSQGLKLS